MDRLELIEIVSKMIGDHATPTDIVDAVIAGLTPEDDGEECPICGICP